MKTSPGNTRKANFGRAILMVALAIALGSTGCQKEDELMPSTNNLISENAANATASDNDARTLPTYDASATLFNDGSLTNSSNYAMIKIDHQAGKSSLPDYSVVVRSDGWVIYDGHLNVRIKGRVAFRISDITIPVLHEIFNQYSFYYIVPGFDVYADMPVVYTTYQPTQTIRPKTIYDDCYKYPEKLILIRTSVEELLGIDKYVDYNWQNIPYPVQDPLF